MSNPRFTGKRTGVVLINSSEKAMTMFAGKTLNEVGHEFGLADEDITIVKGTNPKNGDVIHQFGVRIDGTLYVAPLARNYPMKNLADPNWLLECEFRKTFMSVKDDDGAPKTDENGNPVLDTSKPYVSFGKPSGIVIEEQYEVFAPATAEQFAGK